MNENTAAESGQEKQKAVGAPEEKITISSPDSPAAPPPVEKKPLTVLELKTGNVHLPKLFFTRKASPMQFGLIMHGFLRTVGMGTPHDDAVIVPGYLWASEMFSPVEIAVASYLYFDPQATAKTISAQRRLPRRLVERTLTTLEELGVFHTTKWGSESVRTVAKLDDFVG